MLSTDWNPVGAATFCVKVIGVAAEADQVPTAIEVAAVALSEAEALAAMLTSDILVRTQRATLAPAASVPVFVTAAEKFPETAPVSVAVVVQLAAVPISTVVAARIVADAEVAVSASEYVPLRVPELVTVMTPTAAVVVAL